MSPELKFPKMLIYPGQVLKLRVKREGATVELGTLAVLIPRSFNGATVSVMEKGPGVDIGHYNVTSSSSKSLKALDRDFMYTVTYFDFE